MKLQEMTMEELVAAEKAATTVRRSYEDKMILYRGIDYNNIPADDLELSQKLSQVNAIRLGIIKEMEERLLSLITIE